MADTPPAPPEIKPAQFPETTPPVEQVNLLQARLRVSEERAGETRKKILLIEQNMLTNQKKAMAEIKALQNEFNDLKRTIQTVEDRIIMVIKELRLTARKEDIDVMKRYIELWNPTKFVSIDQIDKIIDEKLGRHTEEQHAPESKEELPGHSYDSPS
ncbi:hypothetical protein HY489_01110 [Candidatus Woesearchaeota archaeon]|nr:hypothetical protein [Candidatus Woesearchaeota archaeon]